LKNYRDIDLTGFVKNFQDQKQNFFDLEGANFILAEIFTNILVLNATDDVLKHENVQKLLKSNEKFDLVILEDFLDHALKGFCYHYNAPCIMFSSIGLSRLVSAQIGNPYFPSYMPDFMLPYTTNMNFFQRLKNSFIYVFSQLYQHFYIMPRHNELLQKYFPGAPHVDDLYYNVSLVFLNGHVSTQAPVPLVPNAIEIGGMHIKPTKPLPKDLKEYLDSAKDGAIFFSMGSNLKSIDMPVEKRDAILKTFGKLKQKVLWKWEDENLPGKPSNVKVGKWLPQPDILAHPNVKLFITHGGLLSTVEAVYHGLPVVGIPVYGDQKMNLGFAVSNGFGLEVPYSDLTEEKLSAAIQEILTNPKYGENAKTRSKIMHDQPMKPLDKAVFWVEYVLRHQGAPHLRTAAINLTWYQYLLLDVVLFVLGVIAVVLVLFYLAVKRLFKFKSKKKQQKVKKS